MIIRRNAASTVFATVLEQHGMFEPVDEISNGASGRIKDVKVLASTDEGTVVQISGKENLNWILMITNKGTSEKETHTIRVNDKVYEWSGPFKLIK